MNLVRHAANLLGTLNAGQANGPRSCVSCERIDYEKDMRALENVYSGE